MQKLKLENVSTIQDIKNNIRTFNEQVKDNLDIMNPFFSQGPHNWVYDSDTSQFGPGKFVGYKEMDFSLYRQLQEYNRANKKEFRCNGVPFDGGHARKEIEKVIREEFFHNPGLINKLKNWAANQLGIDSSRKNTDKWKFLQL